MTTPRVFILQDVSRRKDINVDSAKKFGSLISLLPNSKDIVYNTSYVKSVLKKHLHSYSDDDYLLLIGHPFIIGLACSIASDANRGQYSSLVWDKEKKSYLTITVNTRK